MFTNFSEDNDDEYEGLYGEEEITREIIKTKHSRIKNTEG